MDRNLQIALVSSALAIAWGYGLRQRIRHGDTQIVLTMVYRKDEPGTFWTIMFFAAVAEVAIIGMAITHFIAWLHTP